MRDDTYRSRAMRCVLFVQGLVRHRNRSRADLATAVADRFQTSRSSAYRLVGEACDALGINPIERKLSPEHREKVSAGNQRYWAQRREDRRGMSA